VRSAVVASSARASLGLKARGDGEWSQEEAARGGLMGAWKCELMGEAEIE
jgi:hypothetical protein